jgi:hypothetical protein
MLCDAVRLLKLGVSFVNWTCAVWVIVTESVVSLAV